MGADGIHSVVREQAGIGFQGGQYEESFVLADVRLSGDVPVDEVILFWARAGLTVVAPLPDGSHRIVAPVSEAPESPSVEFIQQLLDTRGSGAGRMVVTDIVWGSRFRIHHRVADTYRAGRLLLAGDAAHVHSPAGGQGMNLGIQDAVALADALSAVLAGGADSLLDEYSAARRPIAQSVVAMTDRLTRLATLPRRCATAPQHRYRAGGAGSCGSSAPWPGASADWFTADELGAATGAEPQHPGGGAHLDQRQSRRQRHDGRLLLHRRRPCHVPMHRGW